MDVKKFGNFVQVSVFFPILDDLQEKKEAFFSKSPLGQASLSLLDLLLSCPTEAHLKAGHLWLSAASFIHDGQETKEETHCTSLYLTHPSLLCILE